MALTGKRTKKETDATESSKAATAVAGDVVKKAVTKKAAIKKADESVSAAPKVPRKKKLVIETSESELTPEPTIPQEPTAPSVVEDAPESSSDAAEVSDSKIITMKSPIIVKDLAVKINLKPFQVVHLLMEMNIFATLNQTIDEDTAKKICESKGFTFEQERRKEGGGIHKVEEVIVVPPPPVVTEETLLTLRPPIITFMGHVDHGKTSLLDAIRTTKVAAGEAGGITQHIGAYSILKNGHTITFLDTPGHEAFTAMRARGANLTDIAVIVVAADDGLMPQTLEAIQHAKAANVSIVVAINKIDLPGANLDRIKSQLQEKGLTPEDWGGDTIACEVSATKKIGIDKLLEMLLLQAEILELKADPTQSARGSVVESQVDVGRGPNATIIVQHGTLKVGDAFICGQQWGKAKALINDSGESIKSAGPSTPVKVMGFSGSVVPGDELLVMRNEREARTLAEERQQSNRLDKLSSTRAVTLEGIFSSMAEGQKKILNLILKTDVQGSLEAILESLKKLPTDKVQVNFVMNSIGPITVNDVLLAKASQAVVIGFNTKTDNSAAISAKREEVQIKLYSVIYELIDQVREAMTGLLDPELRESTVGRASVKKVFALTKYPVAGCMVDSGRIVRTGHARVLRKGQPIYDGTVQTLKRFQDDASEVRTGMECGIRLGNFDEYLEGDTIECYILEKVAQQL
ncbi:MAG: translation initiation factor IF-2 [Blastochloris sp.]|nr:translation initiation factor IF-2 [Blastochloris sp.]